MRLSPVKFSNDGCRNLGHVRPYHYHPTGGGLIWRNPWNFTSCLYIWNRYYALIVMMVNLSYMFRTGMSDEVCYRDIVFQGLSGSILICTVDSILAFRVWILYEKSRKILWFLIVLISGMWCYLNESTSFREHHLEFSFHLAEFIAVTTITLIAIGPKRPAYYHLGSILVGCWPQLGTYAGGSHLLSFYYSIPPVIASFVMLLMTLYRCLFWNHMKTPIFSLFLRDGVFWFLAVLLVIVPEIVTGALTRDSRALSELMIIPTLAVFSLIGSRVMLNIKMFLAKAEVSETTNARTTFGDRVTEFKAATRDIGSTTADIEITLIWRRENEC
ncbi:hypothetical protein BD779DRAFT_1801567 [Infundibulicybe gibba]|nr:hypothetical protein BD779DRAFT_1801567 [Infundibulicybe gibba]